MSQEWSPRNLHWMLSCSRTSPGWPHGRGSQSMTCLVKMWGNVVPSSLGGGISAGAGLVGAHFIMEVSQLLSQDTRSPVVHIQVESAVTCSTPGLELVYVWAIGEHGRDAHLKRKVPWDAGQPMEDLQRQQQAGHHGAVGCPQDAVNALPNVLPFAPEGILSRTDEGGQLCVVLQQV